MGWLIALGIIVALAVMPLGISVTYDEAGAAGKLILGLIRLTLFPKPKKKKKDQIAGEKAPKESKPQVEKSKTPDTASSQEPKKTGGGSVADFLPFVRMGLDFLGDLRRKLRVNRLDLKVVLAGDDPCDLALNYARAWEAVGNLQPRLERVFVIKSRNIDVECDFTAQQTLITARLDLTITLGRILALAAVYGVRGIKEFLRFKNKRKGGAVHEQKSS